MSYNIIALGKGIETRYYEFGKISYSGSRLIYDRRINPLKDVDVSSAIIDDLTRYYWDNPVGETYNNWITADSAKVFSKIRPVFKVCVVDTTVAKYSWFVAGTGEAISSDIAVLTPYKDESGLSLEDIKQVDSAIKVANAILIPIPADTATDVPLVPPIIPVRDTASVLPVVVSSSTLKTLSELSQEKIKGISSIENSEIEMLKGGLSESEAQELINRGRSPSATSALRSLSIAEIEAITELKYSLDNTAKIARKIESSSTDNAIYIVKKTDNNNIKFDPTDDYYVKPLNKSQQEELYWQTIMDIGNSMITGAGANAGCGPSPLNKLEEIIEQKPADFKENKFEIYDELMLIATDPTNSRISELITPLHVTSSDTGISAGDNSIKTKQKSAWVRGLYGFINQGQELEQMGFKGNNYGGTVGIDTNITDDTLIGISYTRMLANFKYKIGAGNKANTTSDVFSLYGVSELTNDFILQGLASIGRIQVKQQTQRKIGDNKFKTVYSSFDVDSYSAEAVLNYQIPNLQKYYIMPSVGIRFSKSYDEGYEETNVGVFNMKTSPRNYTSWLLLVGVKAGINYNLSENFSLIPGVHTQVGKYIGNKTNNYQVSTVVETFTANVPVKSRGTAYNIGSTLRVDYKNKAEILFSYNAHLIGKYLSHQGSLSFKYFF